MDQPKPNSHPSIAQPNLQNINSPALQFIMNFMRNKLLQNSSIQSSQSSSNSTSQRHSQKLGFGSSSDSSTASSPLSPSLPSTDSSFLLSTKQFQSPQTSSSFSQLNLGSLVNFNLSAVLNAASSSNKRSKSNSQSKLNNSKNHALISSSSSEPSTEIESISTAVKTKKKKSAFKFDNRKYVRRSFTPMGELLHTIKVPTFDCNPPSTDSGPTSINHSRSFVLSDDEFEKSLEKYDLVKSHQILELYEARIQMGHDDVHLHPALAIKAADEQSGTVFSKEEIKRFDNYDEINVYQPRPKFWPSRIWDNQNSNEGDLNIKDEQISKNEKTANHNRPTELTDKQSDQLQKMIEDSYKIPEIEVTYSSKSSKTQKKKKLHRTLSSSSSVSRFPGIKNLRNQKSYANMASTIINLYAINLITDDSDLDTDLEDF